jgi:hypothetical protein
VLVRSAGGKGEEKREYLNFPLSFIVAYLTRPQ